jgi:peptide/nickel transport system substrate-binding protein
MRRALLTIAIAALAVAYAQAPAGRVVVAQGVDIETLDPTFATSTATWNVLHHIFEPLMLRDRDMVLQPVLALSWEAVDEFTWEFVLRQDVTFHSGAPFDAEAVKFSFERMFSPDTTTTHRAVNDIPLDHVEVVDEYTVRVITTKPTVLMPHFLRTVLMIDPTVYTSNQPLNTQASGTGPYRFESWVRDSGVELRANTEYWGGTSAIAEVAFRPIPENSTRVAELLTGAVDLIVNVPPDDLAAIETSSTTAAISLGGRDVFIGLRADKAPFDDVRVRQAVNFAVDRDAINQAVLGGYGELYGSVVMPPNDSPNVEPYPYDPERARELLAEAGYPNGLEITLQTPNGRYLKDVEAAQAVGAYLDMVGIKTRVEVLEWSVFSNAWQTKGTQEMFLLGLGGWFDGQGELTWLRDTTSNSGWVNEEFEAGFQQLAGTFDLTEREALIHRLDELAFAEAPWLFLWRQPSLYGVASDLNWEPRRDENIFLWDATLD